MQNQFCSACLCLILLLENLILQPDSQVLQFCHIAELLDNFIVVALLENLILKFYSRATHMSPRYSRL